MKKMISALLITVMAFSLLAGCTTPEAADPAPPTGSVAPTPSEFKANAVSGHLGFGSMEVTKNTNSVFYVNGVELEELVPYELYLWLTDFDGAKSSEVVQVPFTTIDGTPPVFLTNPLNITGVTETSVDLSSMLSENGTVYWAVVKRGELFPKPLSGSSSMFAP